MFKPSALITLLLATLLTACGGDSGGSVVGSSSTDGSTDSGTGTGGDSTTGGTDSSGVTITPVLGSGSDADFEQGALSFSSSYVVQGGSLKVSVSAVNSNTGVIISDTNYEFVFSSQCASASPATASFLTSTLITSGTAEVTYKNGSCLTDTITADLYAVGVAHTATNRIATASSSIAVLTPQIGSGSGVNFYDGVIGGDLTLNGESSTVLSATVVVNDSSAPNALLASSNYEASWSSSCADGSFSISKMLLTSGSVSTRYDGNLTTCLGSNTVTLSVYPKDNPSNILDTASIVVLIQNGTGSSIPVAEALGNGVGASYVNGVPAVDGYSAVAGSDIKLTVNAVDKNQSNALLTDTYQYTFSSVCQAAGQASFSIPSSISATGTVESQYHNINCSAGDTITVRLFAADVDTSVLSNALASASLSVSTALPKLGSGTGADFIQGLIAGNSVQSGSGSVELSAMAVNPLSNNASISGDNYEVSWTASCTTGSFSLDTQNLTDSSIVTRYTSDLVNCLGNNTITLELYERATPAVVIASASKVIDVQLGVDPKIGTGSAGTFSEGGMNISPALLSAGGTALISVSIVDANNSNALVSNKAYGVAITSGCYDEVPSLAKIAVTESVVSQGEARFSYEADGCIGSDVVTANLYNVVDGEIDHSVVIGTATATLTVNKAEIGAIGFTSASSQLLSIKGIGNPALPAQSSVSFTVLDRNGNPVVNQPVSFELTNDVGGISITNLSDITDADGIATAIVEAGSAHATFSVIAKTTTDAGAELRTSSLPLSVTTGYADQDSMSISFSVFNPGAYDVDGTTVAVTVYAADQFQNPVPDDTVINFTAESGLIASTCNTVGGKCSVNWQSSGVRSGNHNAALQRVNEQDAFTSQTIKGMTTILAYMQGESGFTDGNGNGLFDIGEPFVSYPEVFEDDNWNAVVDNGTGGKPVEFFADFNNDGLYSAAPAVYQGLLCTDSAKGAGNCSSMMNVRASGRIVQSVASIAPTVRYFVLNTDGTYAEITNDGFTYANYVIVLLQDANGNIPASGTSASFSADGYKITGDSGAVPNSIGFLNETAVPVASGGFPVTRGALYGMSITLDDPTKRGPLETNISFTGGTKKSGLGIRTEPTVKLVYQANNADQNADGDTSDLGEEYALYKGQQLGSSPVTFWAVIEDPDTGIVPDNVVFNASSLSDAAIGATTKMTTYEVGGNFPIASFADGAEVYKFTVTKNTDSPVLLKASAGYPGGASVNYVNILFP